MHRSVTHARKPKSRSGIRGEKVSDYVPREINIMGHLVLVTRPQEFIDRAKASAVVKETQAKIEAQAGRALERMQ